MNAPSVGRAVEIVGSIDDYACGGEPPVPPAAEVIQSLLGPASAGFVPQLPHCTLVEIAAHGGRAVEIAGGIEAQAGCGSGHSVGPEAIQHLFLAGSKQ